MTTLRVRTHEVLSASGRGGRLGKTIDVVIITMILANVAATILQSVQSIHLRWDGTLDAFERVSMVVFALEYVARIWSCTADPEYAHPLWGRLRFAVTPFAVIDLVAILPFLIGSDMRFVRVLRLFKIGRYFKPMRVLVRVFAAKRYELWMSMLVICMLLVVASSAMYHVEHEAQPVHFSSIPAAMWWGVATLTTVGYGDVYPITGLGRFLGAFIAVLGVGMFAIPAGVLAGGFAEAFQKDDDPVHCQRCGAEVLPEGGADEEE